MSRDPETSATSSPRASAPSRRTILTGAAWSVPVIAAASIAPIASASGVTALAFDKATYNGTACGTITGAYVTVTVGGVPTAGQSVTVTLSGGYTFQGGATTNTQVSGANGRVNLPAINVPGQGGTSSLAAVTGTTTATASAIAPGVSVRQVATIWNANLFPAIPGGITVKKVSYFQSAGTPDYYGVFLGSDGYVYKSLNSGAWTKISPAGVTYFTSLAVGDADPTPLGHVVFTAGTSLLTSWNDQGGSTFPAAPTGITMREVDYRGFINANEEYAGFFLGDDGYVYRSLNATAWQKVSPGGITAWYATPGGSLVYSTNPAC